MESKRKDIKPESGQVKLQLGEKQELEMKPVKPVKRENARARYLRRAGRQHLLPR